MVILALGIATNYSWLLLGVPTLLYGNLNYTQLPAANDSAP